VFRDYSDERRPDAQPQPSRHQPERPISRPMERVRVPVEPRSIEPGERRPYSLRQRTYYLNESQKALLNDVGAFRVARAQDIVRYVYGGAQERFKTELSYLTRNKLIRVDVGFENARGRQFDDYMTLGKVGKELTNKLLKSNPEQVIYSGIKKPSELDHDAQLYRMFKTKEAELRSRGISVKRVVLDYEFKKIINSRLARVRKGTDGYRHVLERLSQENQLKILNGKIAIPDVRVEYEDERGGLSHCDLEFVSVHYSGRQITEKKAAGFSLYSDQSGGRTGKHMGFIEDLISL
jgi:hypothetical protein